MLTYAESQSKALEKALETLESSNAQSASEIAAVEQKAKDKALSALLQASCTSSSRPHTLVAQGLIH
jgi:aconitase A